MKFPRTHWTAALLGLALASASAPAAYAQDAAEGGAAAAPTLASDVESAADDALALSPSAIGDAADEIYRRSAAEHGDIALLRAHLESRLDGETEDAARRLLGHLEWRHGELRAALRHFERLARDASDLDARLAVARLHDATGSAKKALEAYGAIVEDERFELEDALESRLRLRMALMSMAGGGETEKDALAAFAREPGRPVELRNRCATVLALLGRPGDAADLYVVPETLPGTAPIADRKKATKAAANGHLRVAEWALRAGDFPRAQEAAWRAVHLATVGREVRYGLTLLSEAHRGDDSLDALLARFDAERETLPADARSAWIELLRETGATDEAIAMTQGADADAFTADERRRLLEMYREADRTEEMVAVYRDLIADQPQELVWRSGLSRYFLETGDRPAATDVWESWFEHVRSGGKGRPLDAADALAALGLDDLAMRAAELAIESGRDAEPAFLFLYDLHRDRGRLDDARTALDRLDAFADPGAAVRMPLSDCLERLGDLDRAVAVLEGVRAARGEGKAGEDLEMRLAWLYSEVGEEERALDLWRELWTRVQSVARRRFVEDRLMTVAARLGVLADIAVDLERKLFEGTADQRDSGLLVRLYTKVGDAVSAAEITDEFLRQSGGTELEALTEKARIYLSCNDYYHYEKAVAALVEIDPEGRPDYYRQLAMSQLERGKPDQARTTLLKLQDLPGGDDSSAEFEAGVLALSGLREEAVRSYRRGLAAHPERIDSYLLMANLLKETGDTNLAVGMFQYQAETAERDDLFTIAIDGLMNMLVDAPPRPKMTEWARRITLERLAATEDRPYLYQLLADLAEETGDEDGQIAALENSLAAAGPRRASVLRELMELSKPAERSFSGPGRKGDRGRQLAFGRRLVGLGELVPPDVYLDLGDAFLEAEDEASAARTFDLTREFPDGALYQQLAAERFEEAGFVERALERYQAVLAASPTNIPLLAKVAELTESLGDDATALDLYLRAYGLLMARKPLFEGGSEEEETNAWMARNVDEFDQSIERVLQGVLATLPDDAAVAAFLAAERAAFQDELVEALEPNGELAPAERRIARHPRHLARLGIVRRIAFATDHADAAEALDRAVLETFPGDDAFLDEALTERVRWGRFAAAKALLDASGVEGERREQRLAKLGGGSLDPAKSATKVPFDTAIAAVLPTLAGGDNEALRALVRRADTTGVTKEAIGRMAVLFAAARATGDPQLMLGVGRDWLRLQLQHGSYPYALEQNIETIVGALDAETGLALARDLVARVLDDPEKNSQYVTILPNLAQRFGESVVDVEEVRTLLDGFGDRYAWGLGPVLSLLPAADRASALRGVWSKLEASNRAAFLVELVTESKDDVGVELADFIRESLPDALEDADDFIQYRVNQLLEVEHSHALCAELARRVLEKKPDLEHLEAAELVHLHALEPSGEEAAELARRAAELWVSLAPEGTRDYYRDQARSKLLEVFGEDGRDAFFAALDRRTEADGASSALTNARIDLALDTERYELAEEALETALREEPDDAELLQRQRRLQIVQGDRVGAARTLERMAEVEKDDTKADRHLRSLVNVWKALHAPEEALAARRKLDGDEGPDASSVPMTGLVMVSAGGMMVVGGGADESDGKGLARSFEDVRKALGKENVDQARAIFRRLWRQFPVGQPQTPRYYSPYRYRNLALGSLAWPADEDAQEGEPEPDLGGYLSYDPDEPEPAPEPPNAYARIGEVPELVAEERRFLRTVQSNELDRLQRLLEGLLEVEIDRAGGGDAGAEEVLGGLLAKADAGETGRADQIVLLALLDRFPERVTGAAAEALADLVRTMPPRDAAQIRRLARVLHQSGSEEVALRLYGWCARVSFGGRSYGIGGDDADVVTTVSDRELVTEARDHLEGDAQIALIEEVLDSARPPEGTWGRERYEQLVLDTWSDVASPAEALARSRSIVDAALDLDTGLRRGVALRAAPMLAEAGEYDRALRALEIGLAKLDPADVKQPAERWYRVDPTRTGRLGDADLRRLFPPVGEGGAGSAEWYARAAASLEAWVEAERFEERRAVMPLALLAIRLAEAGRTDEAAALAERLYGRRDDVSVLSPSNALWVIDALRASGADATADAWEVVLFREGRLDADRMPLVARRIAAAEGAEAALEAASSVLQVSRHEGLLAALIEIAQEAGDEESAANLRALDAAARSAREELERLEAETKG